jgi:hypothetical protein
MPYIALKTFDAPGGGKRRPGDVVPEAETWRNPQAWIGSHHVKWVSDDEIENGRWRHYEAFAGGRAVAPSAVAAAPAKPAAKPAIAPAPPLEQPKLTKRDLSTKTKDELIEIAEGLGVSVDPSMLKSEIIGAILDAG